MTVSSLRRLLTQATPGEWAVDQWDEGLDVSAPEHAVAHIAGAMTMADDAIPEVRTRALADAALIVAAVNALPDLLALHDAAKAMRDAADEERATRHWTNGQRREAWGDEWPRASGDVLRRLDASVAAVAAVLVRLDESEEE